MAIHARPFMWLVFSSFLVSGCDQLQDKDEDFGASMVAGFFAKAKARCGAVGTTDLFECADMKSAPEARRAAIAAQDSLKGFQAGCYSAIGMTKCDRLLTDAMARPTAQK